VLTSRGGGGRELWTATRGRAIDRILGAVPRNLLAAVRRRQRDVLSRGQLRAAGCDDNAVRSQLEARRWQSLNDTVICLHNGPLTREQQLWAVMLSAQTPAALCGLTGMQVWGVTGFETDDIRVVVGRGARVLSVPGVFMVVHESRRFAASEVRTTREPAVLPLARCVIDAAVWTRDLAAACRIVVAPVQQRRCSPQALRSELEKAGRVRRRHALLNLLIDLEGGAQALSEVEFLAFCRRHGLPRPQLQHRLDSRGRRRYLDATFRRTGGKLVRVEIDGGVHLDLTTRWRDTAKDNDAAIDGELVLRFPSVAVYTDDPRAVAQLRRAVGLSNPPSRVVSSTRAYSHVSC
jgi:hypothetical protein